MEREIIKKIAYGYGIFTTFFGTISMLNEIYVLPGLYKVFAWAWLPLLVAYWFFISRRQIAYQYYWRLLFILVLISDIVFNFYVAPAVMHEPTFSWGALVGFLLIMPLYCVLGIYAFQYPKVEYPFKSSGKSKRNNS